MKGALNIPMIAATGVAGLSLFLLIAFQPQVQARTGLSSWQLGLMACGVIAVFGFVVSHVVQRLQVKKVASKDAVGLDRLEKLERQIKGLMLLNQNMADFQDENTLMNTALQVITEISGATAASFISLDEWGQTLPAYAQGGLPEAMLRGWAEHVITERTQNICSVCYDHEARPGKNCPLLQGPFLEHFGVFCLPFERGDRLLGMLNLYYPAGIELAQDLRAFLSGLLNMLIIAVSSIRLRNQERETLKHIQMARSGSIGLTGQLAGLIHNLRQGLSADYLCLQVLETEREKEGLRLDDGAISPFARAGLAEVMNKALKTGKDFSSARGDVSPDVAFWAFPLNAADGKFLGVILAVGENLKPDQDSQQKIMGTVADQIIVILEVETYLLSLEYRMVIQERSRLAREIHDSLAQTLAFLKLQTAQMQALMQRKDYARLETMLGLNHQALSDAYLDTRQAIDNLRLKPDLGLLASLEQAATIFEENTGILVEKDFSHLGDEFPPEIQLQLLRIIQEALGNVRKHAKARHVRLALKDWEGDIILEVQDDGIGFHPHDVLLGDQHGLRGMRERAELIGADFQVESGLRKGTIIRLRLPKLQEKSV